MLVGVILKLVSGNLVLVTDYTVCPAVIYLVEFGGDWLRFSLDSSFLDLVPVGKINKKV